MRWLFLTLLLLVLATALALFAREDPGYVLISIRGWQVEGSVTLFTLLFIVTLLLSHLLLRWSAATWNLPHRLSTWSRQRSVRRSQAATQKGLLTLAEGHWARAEKLLSRAAEKSDTPLLNYLAAARAAQKLGSDKRRDHYLALAHHSMPEAELAVGLTQADVQLSHGQLEQALATLRHLRGIAPKHPYVLYLLKRLYEKLESWDDLMTLLPDLKRLKLVDEPALHALETNLHRQLLLRLPATADHQQLEAAWSAVPKGLRLQPELVGLFSDRLVAAGLPGRAERLLREALRRDIDSGLLRRYGRVVGDDPALQLSLVEGWLKAQPGSAELMLTAGRLALHNELWGKAQSLLEASLAAEPRAETYCELGHLLQQIGNAPRSIDYYRLGLEAAVGCDCTAISTTQRSLPHH